MMNSSLLLFSTITIAFVSSQTGGVFEKAVGPCINDECPKGNSCYYAQCIPSDIAPEMPVPDKSTAVGPCKLGGMCDSENKNYCYKGDCYPHPKFD